MGLFDKVSSEVGKVTSKLGGTTAGASVGTLIGGPLGGLIGGIAGSGELGPLKNTPFDPSTWTPGNVGIGGGGSKGGGGMGSNIPMPTLSSYQGLDTIGGKGMLNAQTIKESPWMNMALEKQAMDQSRAYGNAINQQQSALAQGRSNLAMKGGLSSGAAERMASQGANDLATTRQNILGQGISERANLGMQAADRGTDIAKFNAGNIQGAEQFNVGQSIADLQRKNEQDRFRYGEEMKLKGAGMSADAMQNAGKK